MPNYMVKSITQTKHTHTHTHTFTNLTTHASIYVAADAGTTSHNGNARVEAYANTSRLSCPRGSKKYLEEDSRKRLTVRGM